MAKRKASGGTRRTTAGRRATSSSSGRGGATRAAAGRRKTAAGRGGASNSTPSSGDRPTASAKGSRKAAGGNKNKAATRKATAATSAPSGTTGTGKRSSGGSLRALRTRTVPVRRTAGSAARKTAGAPARKTTGRPAPAGRRRMDEDLVQTPPSSLDMDRSASAVRTGRQELREKFDELTQTSPVLTGGDVDADWESAYSVGDEAPGGDNPTPDQDIVDDIGRAVGIEYQDTEELKGDEKVARRDRHRWELDPASSEDYEER